MKVRKFIEKIPNILISKIFLDKDISISVIDSRKVVEKSVFFAIKGENVDGNDFIDDAIAKGASLIVMSDPEKFNALQYNKVLVKDTVECIVALSKIFYQNCTAKKIIITGSFGKTTTKEMLRSILSIKYKVHSTSGNYNNRLGVAITGVSIPDDAQMVIVEIGSNASGEIAELSATVNADVAIVTNVGHAHIGKFASLDKTIAEKLSVTEGLKDGGVLIIPYQFIGFVKHREKFQIMTFSDEKLGDISITRLFHRNDHIEFNVTKDDTSYMINSQYMHLAINALPLILFCKYLEMKSYDIETGLSHFSSVVGRGNIIKKNNLQIIDDSYNAGLESIIKSIESLAKMDADKKYAVIGEVAEIDGFEMKIYNQIYELAILYSHINFIMIGEDYIDFDELKNCKIFKDKLLAGDTIKAINSGVVLVKASHSKNFTDIVNILKESKEQ